MTRILLLESCAGAALLAGASIATPALAQTASPAVTPAPPQADDGASDDGQGAIIVTGSRLQNSGFQAPTPVAVLNAERIEQRAPVNIADVVNDIPAFRVSRGDRRRGTVGSTAGNPNATSGSQNQPDLRGIGEVRTLVLINGRRTAPTNYNNGFDLNMIPVSLVDRVEVVTGGASAAYGSDAVAGVVNFILKDHFEGAIGNIQSGITRYGDGQQYTASMAVGTAFADGRGHIVLGADYNKSKAVGNIYSRPWGRLEPGLISRSSRPATEPGSIFAYNVEPGTATPGGLITSRINGNLYAFDSSGNPFVFNQGTLYGTYMIGSTANYGYRDDNGPLRFATGRQVAYARADFAVSDAITLFAEANYGRTTLPTQANSQYTTTYTLASSDTRLPAAFRALIPAGQTSVTISRLNFDFGGISTSQTNVLKRGVVGANGTLFDGWKWDAYYQYGRTHQDFHNQGLSQAALTKITNGCSETGLTTAQVTQVRLYEQLTGKNCAGLSFNPVGYGAGNSAAAYNYFLQDQTQQNYMTQQVAAVSIAGSPFSVWGGPVSVATGMEWRKDELDVIARFPFNAGLFTTGNFGTFAGSNTVKEGFLEVGVPLIKDVPFIHALDLNGAVRRTDYRLSGAVTTWKVGAVYEPLPGVRFRATQSRDIRAPTLRELYQISAQSNQSVLNTVPVGRTGANGSVNVITGARANALFQGVGNPALKPERADTFTGGVVIEQGAFHASVDYYNIKINGAISSLSVQQTIDQCGLGVQAQCANITFDSSALGISNIKTAPSNLNVVRASGIDFLLAYRLREPLGIPGVFDFSLMANHAIHASEYSPAANVTTENAGTLSGPARWSGNFNINYHVDQMSLNVEFEGFNGFRFSPSLIGPDDPAYAPTLANSIADNKLPGAVYVNLGFQFAATEKFTFYGNVDNVFNRQPPAYIISPYYDPIGQQFRFGVRMKL